MKFTGGDVLLRCLKAQGVRAIFGMPGNQNIGLYDAFHSSGEGIAHYLIRNEQGATMLANGFARATGEVGVALTVPGPGSSNAATGLVDAYTDCVPVLLVTGGYERFMARRDRSKMFHGLNQEKFFKSFTRYFGRPETADDIPRVVTEAFQAMFAGRPGPAVIEIGPDVAKEVASEFKHPPAAVAHVIHQPVNRNEILKAASKVRSMRRPVIIVGMDCVATNACEEVQALAERLQAPVIYGRRGKGVIPDDHPLAAGFMRTTRSANLLQQADGVIAIGVRFTQIDTYNWALELPANVVQIEREKSEMGREYKISAGVCGSLPAAVRALNDEVSWMTPDFDPDWAGTVRSLHDGWTKLQDFPGLKQIRQALPRNGLVSVDVTALGYSCFDRFPIYDSRSLIYPCHSVTLGFAMPAAIGAKLAQPDRAVVSLSGDGGFMMNCNELMTAVEHQVGIVSIVIKDNCLSAIKGSQEVEFDGRSVDTTMQTPDFVALARSFGAHAISTGSLDDLPELIEAGLLRKGPTLIEVQMEAHVEDMIRRIPWLHKEAELDEHPSDGPVPAAEISPAEPVASDTHAPAVESVEAGPIVVDVAGTPILISPEVENDLIQEWSAPVTEAAPESDGTQVDTPEQE